MISLKFYLGIVIVNIIILVHLINYLKLLFKRFEFDKLDLLTDLSVVQGDGTWLSNSANFNLFQILKKIKEFNKSHFVDLGCGKGGTLFLVASFFNGNKITGLERDLNAVNICKKNLAKFKQIEIKCDDVKKIEIEQSMNFFYMYNPFGTKTMLSVLDNIILSMKKVPRDIYILYRNPVENSIILKKGFILERTFSLQKMIGKRHWYYESSPTESINFYSLKR